MLKAVATPDAPAAIGCYSQAVQAGPWLFISGQIPLHPQTMQLVGNDFESQCLQVFKNIQAVTHAAGASLSEVCKLTIYLTDLAHFAHVNETMAQFFTPPYPARATVQVAALPKQAQIEIDGVIYLAGQ